MAERRTPPTWESTVFSVSSSSSIAFPAPAASHRDTFEAPPNSPSLRANRPRAGLLGLGLNIPIQFEINSPSISSAEDLGRDTPIKTQDLPMTPGISPSPTSKTTATFAGSLRSPAVGATTPTKTSPATSYFEFGLPSVQVKIPLTPTMSMLGSMISPLASPSVSPRHSISTPRSPLLSGAKSPVPSPAPQRTHRSAILEKLKIGFPSSSEKNGRYLTMPTPTTASFPRRRFSWKRWIMIGMVALMTVAVLQSILRTPPARRYRKVKYVGDRADGPSYHDPEGQERFKALMTFMQRESDDLAARVPVELPPEVQADEEYISPAEEEMQQIQRGSGFKWKPEFEGSKGIHYGVEEDDEDYEAPPTWMQARPASETGSLTSLDDRIGHSNRPSDAFGLNKAQIARLQVLEERNAISSLRAVIRFISMGGIFPEAWFQDDYENLDVFPLDEALEKAWSEPNGQGLLPAMKAILGPTRSKQVFGPNWELLTDEAKRVVIFSKTHSRESLVVKNIVESYNIIPLPHIVELDQRYDGTILEQIVQELTSRRAVGNAVLNWKLLGGAEELMMADSEGTLARKLFNGGLKIQSRRW